MNDEIGDAKVQVIDRDGANLGIMETAVALRLASEAGLNLVEVAPDAVPAVCKLVQAR
jgi:translation initiation factor IF-3